MVLPPPPMSSKFFQLLKLAIEEVTEPNFHEKNAINLAQKIMKSCDDKRMFTTSHVFLALKREIKEENPDFKTLVYYTKMLENLMQTEETL